MLNLYVKPDRPVVSYLTPLTGCAVNSGALREPGLPCVATPLLQPLAACSS